MRHCISLRERRALLFSGALPDLAGWTFLEEARQNWAFLEPARQVNVLCERTESLETKLVSYRK